MEIVYSTGPEQEQAFNAIIGERAYQDAKWGTVVDRPKQVGSYLTLMRKLLRDAEDNWSTNDNDEGALAELRKVVAVGVACFEQHGVPLREVDSAVVDSAPWTPPAKDARLIGVTNEQLHKGYDQVRYLKAPVQYDFVNEKRETISLFASEIENELEARGDSPIPF